eukprot:5659902-Prymnesium_polylepis.1
MCPQKPLPPHPPLRMCVSRAGKLRRALPRRISADRRGRGHGGGEAAERGWAHAAVRRDRLRAGAPAEESHVGGCEWARCGCVGCTVESCVGLAPVA